MSWSVKVMESYRLYFDPRREYPGRALIDVRVDGRGTYWIWFTEQDPLPDNNVGESTGSVFFPWAMLDVVVDTLREEQPVTIQVEPESDDFRISTGLEPLGEGPSDTSP